MYCADRNRVVKSNERFSLSACVLPWLILKYIPITRGIIFLLPLFSHFWELLKIFTKRPRICSQLWLPYFFLVLTKYFQWLPKLPEAFWNSLPFLFQQEYIGSLLIYGSRGALKLGNQGQMLSAHLVHCTLFNHSTVRAGLLDGWEPVHCFSFAQHLTKISHDLWLISSWNVRHFSYYRCQQYWFSLKGITFNKVFF